jgi:HEAT repeat protein
MAMAETIGPSAALKAIGGYTPGQDPQIPYDLQQLVPAGNSRSDAGAAAARNKLSAKIANALASKATPTAKEFLCRLILTLATDTQVPVLVSLLNVLPGSPESGVADAALLDALAKTGGSVKLGIVESLAECRTRQAVRALAPLLNDTDAAMASAAAAALGNIGVAEAEQKLSDVLATVQGARRAPVTYAYLKCANRRSKSCELVPATAIYSRLYVPSETAPIREAAVRRLILSKSQKGIPLAVEALRGTELSLHRTAFQLIGGLPGNAGTTLITEQLSTTTPSVQVFLLEPLADPGDTSALPAVEKVAQSEDASVRAAAVKALGVLGKESQAPRLSALQLIQHPEYRWQKTESTVALLNHDRTVWQFNYGRDARKPYFHPVALIDGTVLTCLTPHDHPWHLAMWFSWDKLNGVQYWKNDLETGWLEGRTQVVDAKAIPNKDYSATILLTLTYHPPDGAPVLTEERKITVSAPDRDGRYQIDWQGAFTAGKQDVLLQGGTTGGGYAGMSVRISQTTKDWRLIDSEGRVDLSGGPVAKNTHGQQARWMDFSVVDTATGEIGGIAILQHPSTFRFPTHWHNVMDDKFRFGYFSPAPLWAEPYTLGAGKTLKVSYRILVHPGRGSKDQLDAEWTEFSESKDRGNN